MTHKRSRVNILCSCIAALCLTYPPPSLPFTRFARFNIPYFYNLRELVLTILRSGECIKTFSLHFLKKQDEKKSQKNADLGPVRPLSEPEIPFPGNLPMKSIPPLPFASNSNTIINMIISIRSSKSKTMAPK